MALGLKADAKFMIQWLLMATIVMFNVWTIMMTYLKFEHGWVL